MSHAMRRLVYLAMGLLGGAAAWPVLETMLVLQSRFPSYLAFSLASGATFGLIFGAFFGAIDGMVAGVRRRVAGGALIGAATGAVGGAAGFVLGQVALLFFAQLGAVGVAASRAAGWAILGMAVGGSEGVRRRSVRRTFGGLAGGLLGGLAGGFAIEIAPRIIAREYARPIGVVVYGLLVSAMYSLVEDRQTTGMLRLLNGPRKGSEFVLNQRRVLIGEWAGSDVCIPGYRRVAERHAEIREQGGELAIYPSADGNEIKRNDEAIPEDGSGFLKFGDVLQIGSAKLLFRPLILAAALLVGGVGVDVLSAQSVRPAQIDIDRLVTHQQIDLYASITDSAGRPVPGLTADDMRVYEAPDGGELGAVELISVDERANEEDGVTFFFLVDNSGSMYDTIGGRPTEERGATRMAAVGSAMRQFLNQIDTPNDRFALATFNTRYRLLTGPTESPRTIDLIFEEIERPEPDEAYTELFRAVMTAAADLEDAGGRRALIILSDGENFPFAANSGRPHPEFGDRSVSIEETLAAVERAGISVFAIDFAGGGEPLLGEIAASAGGLVFDAADAAELQSVYTLIRERILTEYRIRYRAGISPADFRTVRIEVAVPGRTVDAERRYFAGTIFGLPRDDFGFIYLVPILAAPLLAWLLTLLRARRGRSAANLEILGAQGGSTKVLDLSGPQTVIGASAEADVTIAGSPDMLERHATIVHDEKRGTYTVVSAQPVTVNNRRYTKRTLEAGDVIELPGATIVFDEPTDASTAKE